MNASLRALLCPALLMVVATVSAAPRTVLEKRDTLPAINQRIVDFVLGRMGKKVDRGECWDLAAAALNEAGATWDGLYGFGRVVDHRKDEVLPGDIVQFEGVTVEHRTATSMTRETYGHHTAVVLQVHARGEYTIAHQNFGEAGRKVSTTVLSMADVRGGKLTFHRPQGN